MFFNHTRERIDFPVISAKQLRKAKEEGVFGRCHPVLAGIRDDFGLGVAAVCAGDREKSLCENSLEFSWLTVRADSSGAAEFPWSPCSCSPCSCSSSREQSCLLPLGSFQPHEKGKE